MRILLVEDEPQVAAMVREGLEARGLQVRHVADGGADLAAARQGGIDAIVLDLMLPVRDGLDVLADLRREGIGVPVLLLTARNELGDRLQGLALGADDYLAKPFYVEELVARLQALARRVNGERQHVLRAGGLALDQLTREARCGARAVTLTAREFALLACLMRAPGRVLTRGHLLEQAWGHDFDPGTNVVDVAVQRLRRKLEDLGLDGGVPIEAVRGVGYRFREDGAEDAP